MSDKVPTRGGWRRLRWWQWAIAAAALVAVAAAVLIIKGGDKPSEGMRACRAVVSALRGTTNGAQTRAAVLEVVREQAPVARVAADRDPSYRPVADAIGQIQAALEAGRPAPAAVVLYNRCGS